jgi:hypothetical protein
VTAPVPVEVVTPVPPLATANVPEVIAAVSIAIAVLVMTETRPLAVSVVTGTCEALP